VGAVYGKLSHIEKPGQSGSLYSASHSRVAPENVGLQKERKYNIFACHTCNEVFWEFAKRKLATEKDKIR
jgi:hypothetical protein